MMWVQSHKLSRVNLECRFSRWRRCGYEKTYFYFLRGIGCWLRAGYRCVKWGLGTYSLAWIEIYGDRYGYRSISFKSMLEVRTS